MREFTREDALERPDTKRMLAHPADRAKVALMPHARDMPVQFTKLVRPGTAFILDPEQFFDVPTFGSLFGGDPDKAPT